MLDPHKHMASSSGPAAEPTKTRKAASPESFDSLRRRNGAAEILQSYEKLSWHAFKRCETMTQTRMYFQCIVAGFTAEDDEARILWKEDFTPHPGYEGRSSRKGKERAGTGNAAADARAKGAGSRGRDKAKENRTSSMAEGSKSPQVVSKDSDKAKADDDARHE